MHLTRLASLHRLGPDSSLLVNALSGAVDLVDDELRGKLLQLAAGLRPTLTTEYRGLLLERGYLYADEEEERAALRGVHEGCRRLASSRPVQFVVCPTYSCNLSCSYCFESSKLRTRADVMSHAQVASLFAALEQLAANWPGRPRQLVLFGGEPLLPSTEGVVAYILDRAERAGLTVQIVTNGTHLTSFSLLLAQHRDVVRGVQITLDGPQAVHDARRRTTDGRGSFAAAVRGVDLCLGTGIGVNLRVNLDAHNLEALDDVLALVERRGWFGRAHFQCQIAPVTDHVGTSSYPHMMGEDELVEPVLSLWQQRPELRKMVQFHLFRVLHHLISVTEPGEGARALPRFHYCEADRGDVLTFGPDSLVYVCPESAGNARYAVGTYFPRFSLRANRLRLWRGRSVLTLPECRRCNIATFCGGGCAYSALRQCGRTMRGMCGRAPEIVQAYVRFLQRRLQENSLLSSASIRVKPPSSHSVTGDVRVQEHLTTAAGA
ncbi:MAG: radical SAM protein [Armatimonadota bacterium]